MNNERRPIAMGHLGDSEDLKQTYHFHNVYQNVFRHKYN